MISLAQRRHRQPSTISAPRKGAGPMAGQRPAKISHAAVRSVSLRYRWVDPAVSGSAAGISTPYDAQPMRLPPARHSRPPNGPLMSEINTPSSSVRARFVQQVLAAVLRSRHENYRKAISEARPVHDTCFCRTPARLMTLFGRHWRYHQALISPTHTSCSIPVSGCPRPNRLLVTLPQRNAVTPDAASSARRTVSVAINE